MFLIPLWVASTLIMAEHPIEAAPDEGVRRALERIADSYLEPDRLDPAIMHAAALRAIAERVEPAVLDRASALAAGAEPGSDLVAALAPSLELLLAAIEPDQRDEVRAVLLTAALRAVDRWGAVSGGAAQRDAFRKLAGTYAGVGLRVGRRDGALRVLDLEPGSGAHEAGILRGDTLLAVDERPLARLRVREALALLTGEPGTVARLIVRRENIEHELSFTAERRELVATTIDSEQRGDGVGVIRIRRISQASLTEMRRHLGRVPHAGNLPGIILDLRGNSGGSILTSARIADLFLSAGTLVENLDRAGRPAPGLRPRLEATPRGDTTTPLAVLVDRRSASGAELLAAALTRHGRATLVGERTFGKNVAQALFTMPEVEFTLRLTTAYVHVAGELMPDDGLVPDVSVPEGVDPLDVAARVLLDRS